VQPGVRAERVSCRLAGYVARPRRCRRTRLFRGGWVVAMRYGARHRTGQCRVGSSIARVIKHGVIREGAQHTGRKNCTAVEVTQFTAAKDRSTTDTAAQAVSMVPGGAARRLDNVWWPGQSPAGLPRPAELRDPVEPGSSSSKHQRRGDRLQIADDRAAGKPSQLYVPGSVHRVEAGRLMSLMEPSCTLIRQICPWDRSLVSHTRS